MNEEVLLRRLLDKRAQYSVDALKTPQQRDQFEYGERVGYVRGLTAAIELMTQLKEEEKTDERDDKL